MTHRFWEQCLIFMCVCVCVCLFYSCYVLLCAHSCSQACVLFVLYCVLKLLPSQFLLYQSLSWCWEAHVLLFYLFVCLFICLASDANVTMCALDTRKDSRRETHALTSFMSCLQFISLFVHFLFVIFTFLNLFPDGCCLPRYISSDLVGKMIILKAHFTQKCKEKTSYSTPSGHAESCLKMSDWFLHSNSWMEFLLWWSLLWKLLFKVK